MKKLFFFTIIIILPWISSCNNNSTIDECAVPDVTILEMDAFCTKIDSLNNVYSEEIGVDPTRALVPEFFLGQAADAVGQYVGGKIFGWAGSAIGLAMGSPITVAFGYFAGKKYGGAACSAAASLAAAWVIQRYNTRATNEVSLVLDPNYKVPIEDPYNLSDGELHNLILAKLLKNIEKYVTQNGELNYELLLSDAYEIENEYTPFEKHDSFKKISMPKAIEQTQKIANSSKLLESGNIQLFLDDVYDHMTPEIKSSKTEFNNANILNSKVLTTYIVLDDNIALDFEKEVDDIIDSSKFNTALKAELKCSNSVLKNSAAIWKEVQFK